jgi:hypothetical protein
MTKRVLVLAVMPILSGAAPAQTSRLVRAVGEGVVTVRPDLAKLQVGVVTQANTARDANVQNAAQTEGVLAQLRQVLGANADIKTISYSLTPNYRYNQGAPPTLLGYTATNTVEVNIEDLSVVGSVIDAASQAGANSIGSLQFTIRDQEPLRRQALGLAARQGKTHAEAIAGGLGARVGAVVAASEGVSVVPIIRGETPTAAAPATPIETGLVQVRATVTIEAELLQ